MPWHAHLCACTKGGDLLLSLKGTSVPYSPRSTNESPGELEIGLRLTSILKEADVLVNTEQLYKKILFKNEEDFTVMKRNVSSLRGLLYLTFP